MKLRSSFRLLVLLFFFGCGSERVVFHNGLILTLDETNRIVEALGVEGERIARVGSQTDVLGWAGRGARQVDLAGRALLPGFIEAHGHFPGAGVYAVVEDLNSPPIGPIQNMDELVARMRQRAEATSPGEWVVGMGYDDSLLPERRHPTRSDLDTVSTQHPVAAMHISGHLAVVNGLGLERLGITAATSDPEGGRIRRDPATGEPDGVLEETAMEVLQHHLLDFPLLDGLRIVRHASELYLAQGITTAQMGYATLEQMRAFPWLVRLRMLPLRLILWPNQETAAALASGEVHFESPDPQRLRLGAVKLLADGSIQGYTGYLSQPYHVPPGDDPSYRGYPRIAADELKRLVRDYHARGQQLAVHGNGDAAIDDILDAFEAAQREHPREDSRHVVIHAQMTRMDQLERMRELGVIPSFFSLHTYYWGDRHQAIFMGPERAARMSPARSAQRLGVRFTIHADSPVVPFEAMRLVWSAVQRRSRTGVSMGEAEQIDVIQALRAVTIDAAYQHFEEADKGSLEEGKLADLVILERSPLEDLETIDRIRVSETWVGGKRRYRLEN